MLRPSLPTSWYTHFTFPAPRTFREIAEGEGEDDNEDKEEGGSVRAVNIPPTGPVELTADTVYQEDVEALPENRDLTPADFENAADPEDDTLL